MTHPFHQRRIWITGASTGIGAAVAQAFQDAGAFVALSARSADKLEEIAARAPERSLVVPLDVSDLEATKEVVGRIEARFGGLDMAFLNAGTCEYMDDVRCFSSAQFRKHIEVNYMGLVHGIEAALPALMASPQPQLVGMSSTVAWAGVPRGEAYAASKAAIRNLLQGLRLDLKPHNVSVSIICPGFVETPLTDQNDFPMPFRITAADAAQRILKGLSRKQHEIAFPKRFALIARLLANLPSGLYGYLMRGAVAKQQD